MGRLDPSSFSGSSGFDFHISCLCVLPVTDKSDPDLWSGLVLNFQSSHFVLCPLCQQKYGVTVNEVHQRHQSVNQHEFAGITLGGMFSGTYQFGNSDDRDDRRTLYCP